MASLRRLPTSKNWIACFTDISGKQLQRSTGSTQKKEAQAIADQFEEVARNHKTEAQVRKVLSALYEKIGGGRVPSGRGRDDLTGRSRLKSTENSKGLPPDRNRRRRLAIHELWPKVEVASCLVMKKSAQYIYRIPAHQHHLVFVKSGHISGNPPSGPFEAEAGDLICFRPAEVNKYTVRGPTVSYQATVQFAPPPQHQLTPHLGDWGELPVHLPLGRAAEAMERVFETFCLEISHPGVSHQLRVRSAVLELLAIVGDVLADQGSAAIHLDAWERLRMRLTFQLDKNVRADALAREMGMSRRHFIRLFKQKFGLGPKAFHMRARLHHAARLLRTTDQQIKSIASDVGFGVSKLFQRVFKRYFGVPPSEFRSGSIYAKSELLTESAHAFFFDRFYLAPTTPSNWKDWHDLRRSRSNEIADPNAGKVSTTRRRMRGK